MDNAYHGFHAIATKFQILPITYFEAPNVGAQGPTRPQAEGAAGLAVPCSDWFGFLPYIFSDFSQML